MMSQCSPQRLNLSETKMRRLYDVTFPVGKIRPNFEKLRQNCPAVLPEERNSIGEQIIPFKGRSFLRRYIPKKPQK